MDTSSTTATIKAPQPAANGPTFEQRRAARRIDAMLRRESQGRFRDMNMLATTPVYIPTLRRPELADAYDAMQAARGDSRRACR